MSTTHTSPPTTDEMTHCIVGDELVAGWSPAGITLYRMTAEAVTLLGTFERAEDAWAAVDEVDAPC